MPSRARIFQLSKLNLTRCSSHVAERWYILTTTETKYRSPQTIDVMSQAIRIRAYVLIVGVKEPMWNRKMRSRSSTILTRNLVELMSNGTSRWSSTCVA